MNPQTTAKLNIGVFDSGVGGLTVMKQISHLLPQENIVYFGDTARLPYGSKSSATIIRYSLENAAFLMQKEIKILVVACNTASSCALTPLRQQLDIPVIGTIEPAALKAAAITHNGRIGILGTQATIASKAYEEEVRRYLPDAVLFPIACPLFVPLVEENFFDHAVTKLVVETYLEPLKYSDIDTLLLGCTHYPLLQKVIQEVIGEKVKLVDSAVSCAESLAALLNEQNLATQSADKPQYRYFVSDDAVKFCALGKTLLGDIINDVQRV